MRTYVRTAPMPLCKHCGKRMKYYVIGMPDADHAHPACAGKHAAQKAFRGVMSKQSTLENDDA